MRGIALVALTLALGAGCGGEAGATFVPNAPTAPSRGTWSVLQEKITDLRSARFSASLVTQRCSKTSTSRCSLTAQTIRSTGTFSLNPTTLSSELVVDRAAGEGPTGAVQTRVLPDGSLYSLDPSSSNACWLSWERDYAPAFELAFRTGLAVLRTAQATYDLPTSGRADGVPATANALDVIRTLGLPESLDATYGITPTLQNALRRRTVTVDLALDAGGSTVSFTVNGRQVASELAAGSTALKGRYLETVRNARSTFALSEFGINVEVAAPPADRVVARNAVTRTC